MTANPLPFIRNTMFYENHSFLKQLQEIKQGEQNGVVLQFCESLRYLPLENVARRSSLLPRDVLFNL